MKPDLLSDQIRSKLDEQANLLRSIDRTLDAIEGKSAKPPVVNVHVGESGSSESAAKLIEAVMKRYGITAIYFRCDTFFQAEMPRGYIYSGHSLSELFDHVRKGEES